MDRVILTSRDLKEAVAFYLDQPEFAYDTETMGEYRLDPRRNQVFWLSVAAQGQAHAIPFGHPIGKQIGTTKEPRVGKDGKIRQFTVPVHSKAPDQLWPQDVFEAFEPVLFSTERVTVAQNAKFDLLSVAKYYDGRIPPPPYFDTAIAAFLLDENHHRYSLGDLTTRAFRYSYDKSVGKEVEKHPFKVAARYAYLDAKYTWLLSRKYKEELDRQKLDGLFQLEMDVLAVLCEMETHGSPLVDIDALRELDADLDHRLEEITGDLYRIAGRAWNVNSAPQKIEVFYGPKRNGGQGLKAKKTTKGGAPSCDAEALAAHEGNLLVDTFVKYQDVHKISSTYVKAYLGSKEVQNRDKQRNNAPPFNADTGRIHANFRQTGARTGRFSCSEPNLQNIPRPDTDLGARIRGLFVAAPGESLIVADWSQIEYRILAQYSGDKRLVQAFADGLDFHQYVASLLLGKSMEDVTKVERTLSKNTNFACVPMDSSALTRRGWVGYHDLRDDDEVMAYDGKSMRWTPILEKVYYPEAPLIEMAVGGRWVVRTTPNHRWDTQRRTGRGPTKRYLREFATTESLTTEHTIITSAWADTSDEPSRITPQEAAIIGWVVTDGSIRRSEFVGAASQAGGRRVGFIAQIHQQKYKEAVEEVLRGVPSLKSKTRQDGLVTWTLDSVYARSLWERAGLTKMTLPQFVLGLRPEHRKQFLEACFLAEGHRGSTGQRFYTQNHGDVLEAMRLAVLLEGWMPRTCPKMITELTRTPCFQLSESSPRVTAQRMRRTQIGSAPVWCIRTKYENWVMRQGDVITLTGNTVYGAGLEKIATMSGVTLLQAEEFQAEHKRMLRGVYKFCEEVVAKARVQRPPHVRTLMGRVRRLPDLTYREYGRRGYAERQAVNCFDAETEAMTQRGWVKGFDLRTTDRLLTKNASTGLLEWHTPLHRWFYPDYDGPMVRISNGRSLDVWTTPEHRWLVRQKKSAIDVMKTSAELAALAPKQSDFAIHMQGEYRQTWSVYSDDFASLLGWILTDGYFGATFVGIAQTKAPRRVEIEALLERLGLRYSVFEPGKGRSAQYKIHGNIAAQIKALCPKKTLTPHVVLGMGDSARAALYEAMMAGDGCRTGAAHSFAAGSEARADAFQFLCVLLGKATSKSFRRYLAPAANGSEGCWNVAINRRTTAQTPRCETSESSSGGVWCVTVPNSYAVFRSKGGVFVSGNTVVQGSAADLCKVAMVRQDEITKERRAPLTLNLTVHDEFVWSIPTEHLDAGMDVVKEAMMGKEIASLLAPVPLVADIKIVDCWAAAKE